MIACAAAAALSSLCAEAQTQIGSRYVSAGLSQTDTRDDYDTEAEGEYVGFNLPVTPNIDLHLSLGSYDYDSEEIFLDDLGNPVGFDQDGYSIDFGALFYKTVGDYKAYTALSLGVEEVDVRVGSIDDSDSGFAFAVTVGVEWQATKVFSGGAFIGYSDRVHDIELGGYRFNPSHAVTSGVFGHLRVTEMLGLEAGFAFNDQSNIHFSVGGTVTF